MKTSIRISTPFLALAALLVVHTSATSSTLPTATPSPDASGSSAPIDVPMGSAPTIDGILSPDEWVDAYLIQLADKGELRLMHDEDYLYLGLFAPGTSLIVGSIVIDQGDQIRVLHSSAALGTALFEQDEAGWQLTKKFAWTCRDISNSKPAQAKRDTHLQEEGWLASNAMMGTPGEMEYQIALPAATLRLAVAFIQIDSGTIFWWPEGLSDDVRNDALIGGEPPQTLQFSPEQWMTVTAADFPSPTATPTGTTSR